MASPDILAMGTYVDRGRNLRGRLMAGHSVWIALGRTRYAPSGDNPWTDEANPPVENPADDETSIDTEMTGGDLVYGVPYKKASSVQLVKLDPSGRVAGQESQSPRLHLRPVRLARVRSSSASRIRRTRSAAAQADHAW